MNLTARYPSICALYAPCRWIIHLFRNVFSHRDYLKLTPLIFFPKEHMFFFWIVFSSKISCTMVHDISVKECSRIHWIIPHYLLFFPNNVQVQWCSFLRAVPDIKLYTDLLMVLYLQQKIVLVGTDIKVWSKTFYKYWSFASFLKHWNHNYY